MDLDALLVPPRSGAPEWIDLPETPFEDVLQAMQDIQRINGLLLTYPILLGVLERLARFPADRPLRVLDVATGLADIPRALVDWARRRGQAVEVVGLDLNPRILAMAAPRLEGYPEIRLVEGDALALPFEAGHFDWAMCHLALHHFPPDTHQAFFAELDRVIAPGGGVIVGDLERSRLHYAAAFPFLNLLTSRVCARDGLQSIMNALSARELGRLLDETGLGYVRREWLAPPTQFLVAGVKPASSAASQM